MMYCPTRRVIVARDHIDDLTDGPFDTCRAGAPPRQRDPSYVPARTVTGRHPLASFGDPARHLTTRVDRGLVETLALLEAAAIALGAADLSDESIQTARAADRELRACRKASPTAVRWARVFHHTLLNACPNRHMLDLIDVESLGSSAPHTIHIGADELGSVADDHDAILDMITTGSPRGELERTLRQHASTSALCCMALLGH